MNRACSRLVQGEFVCAEFVFRGLVCRHGDSEAGVGQGRVRCVCHEVSTEPRKGNLCGSHLKQNVALDCPLFIMRGFLGLETALPFQGQKLTCLVNHFGCVNHAPYSSGGVKLIFRFHHTELFDVDSQNQRSLLASEFLARERRGMGLCSVRGYRGVVARRRGVRIKTRRSKGG